jgi:hypothetical protein
MPNYLYKVMFTSILDETEKLNTSEPTYTSTEIRSMLGQKLGKPISKDVFANHSTYFRSFIEDAGMVYTFYTARYDLAVLCLYYSWLTDGILRFSGQKKKFMIEHGVPLFKIVRANPREYKHKWDMLPNLNITIDL